MRGKGSRDFRSPQEDKVITTTQERNRGLAGVEGGRVLTVAGFQPSAPYEDRLVLSAKGREREGRGGEGIGTFVTLTDEVLDPEGKARSARRR